MTLRLNQRAARFITLIAVALFCIAFPASAQETRPVDWIPAEAAGFMRLNLNGDSLLGLNMAAFVGSFLQPTRYDFQAFNSLDALIPLTPLDVEGASFDRDILPWLDDEILIAYQQFGSDLVVDDEDLLFILPTTNAFLAASSLTDIIQGQDLLERQTYRDSTLYVGDHATIAFTPAAVVIGSTDMVEATLDLQAGEGISLVDEPSYRALASHLPDDALLSAYVKGEEARRALSVLVSGSEESVPLLAALGAALSEKRGQTTFEQAVLGDSLGAIAVSLQPDTLRINSVRATLTLYDSDEPEQTTVADFEPSVLDAVPQNSMIVHSGTDASGAVYDVLYTLPLTNFLGEILAGFPVGVTAAAANDLIDEPTPTDIEAAVSGLLDALDRLGNFSLEDDFLQYLSGSYAVAVMPRPNDPSPLNTPYDVLVVAQVNDAESAVEGLGQAAQLVLNLETLETTTIGDLTFQTVPGNSSGEAAVTMGAVDNLLLIGTGRSIEYALDALRGDNRLITRERWLTVSEDVTPHLYLDITPIYNTFFPQRGAPVISALDQLSAYTSYLGEGVYVVNVLVTLPGGLG
jgi:hypothetical protein